jgi:hypothetical protein
MVSATERGLPADALSAGLFGELPQRAAEAHRSAAFVRMNCGDSS